MEKYASNAIETIADLTRNLTIGDVRLNSQPKCTKPPEVPAPSYCGKAPDGVDCYICKFAKAYKKKRVMIMRGRGSDKVKGA